MCPITLVRSGQYDGYMDCYMLPRRGDIQMDSLTLLSTQGLILPLSLLLLKVDQLVAVRLAAGPRPVAGPCPPGRDGQFLR